MSDNPNLYDFTEWLADEYGTNGAPSRASQLGDTYVKQDENNVYFFKWTGDEFEKMAIVEFESKHKARSKYKYEYVDSTSDTYGAEHFIEKFA